MSVVLSKITSFFGMFSSDVLLIVGIFALIFVSVLYFGRGRAVSLILAFYPTVMIFKSLPFMDKLIFFTTDKLITLNKLGIFLIFYIPLYIIVSRYIFLSLEYSRMSVLKNSLLALSVLIVFFIFIYNVVGIHPIYDFSSQIDGLFDGEGNIFYWNILSFGLLAFI